MKMELSLIGSQSQFLSTYPEGKALAVGPLPDHPDIRADIQWQASLNGLIRLSLFPS